MKSLLILLTVLLLPAGLIAQKQNFSIDNDRSSMTIKGGSTVGSWDAEVKTLSASFSIDTETLKNGNAKGATLFELSSFSIPVGDIDADGRRMNRNIHSYLKEDEHPNITFKLRSAEVNGSGENGESFEVAVTGVINAAGSDHPVSFVTIARFIASGEIILSGSKDLAFSDFGIDRPSAMLGTVRADEELEIVYELVLTTR